MVCSGFLSPNLYFAFACIRRCGSFTVRTPKLDCSYHSVFVASICISWYKILWYCCNSCLIIPFVGCHRRVVPGECILVSIVGRSCYQGSYLVLVDVVSFPRSSARLYRVPEFLGLTMNKRSSRIHRIVHRYLSFQTPRYIVIQLLCFAWNIDISVNIIPFTTPFETCP